MRNRRKKGAQTAHDVYRVVPDDVLIETRAPRSVESVPSWERGNGNSNTPSTAHAPPQTRAQNTTTCHIAMRQPPTLHQEEREASPHLETFSEMPPELIGGPHVSPRPRWQRSTTTTTATTFDAFASSCWCWCCAPTVPAQALTRSRSLGLLLLDGVVTEVHQPVRETCGLPSSRAGGWTGPDQEGGRGRRNVLHR